MSPRIDRIVRALLGLAAALIVCAPAAHSDEVTETPAAAAQETAAAPQPQESRRPRIGLVLSGGGARGIAHLGVLKVLDQHRVPIDAIAGTSMGAVIGGLYASGLSAEQIERVVMSIDWQEAFRDRTQRARLSFRRKQDDQNFLVRLPLGLKSGRFLLPRGLIQGQKLNQILRSLTLPSGAVEDFDQLPVPFRAVATDLETGQPVVMRFGDLAGAMRASMSVPGVFAPVVIEDRVLVDGGLAENLPIDVARNMGVDILIVSDVSFPLQPRSRLNSALEVSNQMFAILVRRDAERQRATLMDQDIVIDAPLENMSSLDFTRVRATVAAGVSAAQEAIPRLDALALSPGDYASYVARRQRQREQPARVDFVRADPDSKRYEKPIDAVFGSFVGKPLDIDKVEDKVEELYGLDLFETVDYRLLREDGGQGLEISARRKSWGPNYVRFGLGLQDDFEGNNFFNAAARVIVTEIDPLGAEWLSDVQVGENPLFFTEFYQPLTYGSRYFIAPHLKYEVRNLHILADQQAVADYRVRAGEAGLDFGREFSSWGELRTGIRRGQGRTHLRLGQPVLAEDRFDTGEYFVRLSYDKLDNANFPREGSLFTLQWDAGRTGLGDDNSSDLLALDYLIARTRGRHTLLSWTSLGSTIDSDTAAIQDFFQLGGFFQLSGLKPNSLSGAHFGISRLIYYRQIGRQGPGFLNVASYAGLSLEAGNVWNDRSEASFGSAFKDASLFLGLDTLLGPLYLATGYDDQGETAFYLFLGRPF